jgi:peptide subunit release factor RF-3
LKNQTSKIVKIISLLESMIEQLVNNLSEKAKDDLKLLKEVFLNLSIEKYLK